MTKRKATQLELEEGIGIEDVPEDGFEVDDVVMGEFIGFPEDEPDDDVMPPEDEKEVSHDE